MMEAQFEAMEGRLEELTVATAQPEIIADVPKWRGMLKEMAQLEPAVKAWREYRQMLAQIEQAKEMRADPDLADMAEEELKELLPREEEERNRLRLFLIPHDPNDDRSVVMEIRPGAGGDEAALFAALLLRMYQRYAERKGFQFEPVDISTTELKGVKEAVFTLNGAGAFSRMKFESGVHRIQRVPVTEAGGRIHTSTATVAVLPEAEDVEVQIDPADLRIDTYRASGAGGQHVNRTDSAVRITHIPSGVVVTSQDQRSQIQNREKAMRVLKSRLYELQREQQQGEYANRRRVQVGTGDRSERIRTYNFPQGRVTDHRIGLTLYRIDDIMEGHLDEIIDALTLAEQTALLKES